MTLTAAPTVPLAIDEEDVSAFHQAIAGYGFGFPSPKLVAGAEALRAPAGSWMVAVLPDVEGPLGTVPLLMLFSDHGTPHVPESVTAAVEEFNADPVAGWQRVRSELGVDA